MEGKPISSLSVFGPVIDLCSIDMAHVWVVPLFHDLSSGETGDDRCSDQSAKECNSGERFHDGRSGKTDVELAYL